MQRIILTIAAVLFFNAFSFAQSKSKLVTGLVTSLDDGQPLRGVSVQVKGKKTSSGSQPDGIYYIAVNENDSALVFSCKGHHQREVPLSFEAEYNVELKRVPHATGRSSSKPPEANR